MTACSFRLQECTNADLLPVRMRAMSPESREGRLVETVQLACAGCRSTSIAISAGVIERRAVKRIQPSRPRWFSGLTNKDMTEYPA